MNKLGKKLLVTILTGSMVFSGNSAVFAASTSNEVSEREAAHSTLSKNIAAQGMVLLENKNQVLPIEKEGNIALFGGGAYATIKGGTGAGDVNQRSTVSVWQGLKNAGYHITTEDYLQNYADTNGNNIGRDILLSDSDIAKGQEDSTDTAIYVISRNSGEFNDRELNSASSGYNLTDIEKENIKKMTENFEKSIVLLNVGAVVDTSFLKELKELDGILLMSQAGQEGGNAVAEVLNGTVTPSGKLADTWALQYSDYPASATFANNDNDGMQEDYEEGIYVGYRYFDTFGKDVAYEFGYGMSYTDFSIQVDQVKADEDNVSIDVTVQNIGNTYSGKEVVEVYFSAPDGTIEKPYQELAAYGKTDSLEPGASQKMTITYPTTEMSSYDESRGAYVMESGNYILRVGNSSRNTEVAAVMHLNGTAVTEQLSNQNVVDKELEEYSRDGVEPITYNGEKEQIENAQVIELPVTSLRMHDGNNASPYDDETVVTYVTEGTDLSTLPVGGGSYKQEIQEVPAIKEGTKLVDVYNGKVSMESFVASLTDEQLGYITNGSNSRQGTGPVTGAQANSVRGGAGETTGRYFDSHGIPNIVLADGASGLRITQSYTQNGINYYQYCTAFPIATMLAQTWNPQLVELVGKAVGVEMLEYGCTLWLAPSMNIHRDPLCGRNFEYYSEDPVITGTMGSAAVKGIQSNPGIGATIKHFAANNQETNRSSENNSISERALREIYLKGFEMAVKSAQPMAVMSSYPKINSQWAAGSWDQLTDILRGEWGFKGVVMTDWFASAPAYQEMHAGNDLIMPGGGGSNVSNTLGALQSPTFGNNGYVTSTWGFYGTTENWNDFVLNVNGTTVLITNVSSGTALASQVAEKVSDGTAVVTLTQTGEILKDLADTSEERTVSYTGEYDNSQKLYRGDVQKNVIRILNVIMNTTQFKKMNPEIELTSYTEKYADTLKTYITTEKEKVNSNTVATGLNTLIITIEKLLKDQNNVFTSESKAVLSEKLEKAKATAGNSDISEKELQQVQQELLQAFADLEYGVQTIALETVLGEAEKILSSGRYDNVSKEAVKNAVNTGKKILENSEATQKEVNDATDTIILEMNRLQINPDISSLENLVETAKTIAGSKYTEDSLKNLADTIKFAEKVIDDSDRGESDVSTAYTNLINAIGALQLKGNKAALAAVIDKANSIMEKSEIYLKTSLAGLEGTLKEAKKIYEDENAVQSSVNQAVISLTKAVANARLKGDINMDGQIDTADSVALLKYAAEMNEFSDEQKESADVNSDAHVDTTDAVLILQYSAEKFAEF